MNGIHVLNLEELVLRVERRKNRGFSNWYMRDRQSRAEMTWEEFCRSLADFEPPARLSHALAGLCWDAKVDCKRAHESAQDEGKDGSWVHAYLHRKEGDQSSLLVQSGGRAWLPGAARCGVAGHNEGFARMEPASPSSRF